MLSEENQKQVSELLEYYKNQENPSSQDNLVALLREVQELLNCIPEEIQQEISDSLQVKTAVITRLIKLYPSLTSAKSLHHIHLCLGPRCSAQQSQELLNAVKKAIQQKPFHVQTQNCMKHCSTAPNMSIDEDFYPGVKLEDLEKILMKYS